MQIKNGLTIAIFLLQLQFCTAQIRTFKIDPESSDLSFNVTHLGFLKVEGKFNEYSGSFVVEGTTLKSVLGVINVGSINTNDESRDKSLKSEVYLDENAYPQITYSSTGTMDSLGSLILVGKLKIKDQEKLLRMSIEFNMLESEQRCSIKASTSISRKSYELDFGAMDALVGDEIRIELSIEGVSITQKKD